MTGGAPNDNGLRRVAPLGLTALLGLPPPADARLDEVVDLTVEHRAGVAGLVLGTQVLHHLVGVQHIGPHLVAPGATAVTAQRVHLRLLLLPATLEQPRLKNPERGRP